jgi:hypothetical protein
VTDGTHFERPDKTSISTLAMLNSLLPFKSHSDIRQTGGKIEKKNIIQEKVTTYHK